MVMRQEYKDYQYFSEKNDWYLSCYVQLIEKSKEDLTDRHRGTVNRALIKYRKRLLIHSYTMGETIDICSDHAKCLVGDYLRYIRSAHNCNLAPEKSLEQYIDCLWILSFCYFFNAPKEDVAIIAAHIPFTGNDWLADTLTMASIHDHPVATRELSFPDVYQPLMDSIGLLHEPDTSNQKIQQFLEGYYPSLKEHDVTWHDSHKEEDPERCFHFGYWIFELPALLLSTNIFDDSGFRDHPFYPQDLAGWKRELIKSSWRMQEKPDKGGI